MKKESRISLDNMDLKDLAQKKSPQEENTKSINLEHEENQNLLSNFQKSVIEDNSIELEDKFRCAIAIKSGYNLNWINEILFARKDFKIEEIDENIYFRMIQNLSKIIGEELMNIENMFSADEKKIISENFYYFDQFIMEAMLESCLGPDMIEVLKKLKA